jgi:arylsulfatase A-like enzyme
MVGSLFIWAAFWTAAAPDAQQPYFQTLERAREEAIHMSSSDGPVILIVVDALRPDRMSAYGASRQTTPNIDRLADEGVIFSNYYVNGNWTRPSTATLLTGLPPAQHGVESERDRLADSFVTLGEVLRAKGIPTGAVVGNGNAGSAFGLGRGFDFYADTVKHWQGLPSAEQVVELALPFVKEHKAKPFFLMLFFVDPHDPYHAPEPYENMFVSDTSTRLVRSPHWELGRYTKSEIQRMKDTYDGAVRYTDEAIGGFVGALKREGLYEKSTIMVTSDHGEAFGEHDVFLHSHHFYDEIVRTPLIIRTPKVDKPGSYSPFLFQTLDIFPTIVGLYGDKRERRNKNLGVNILDHLRRPELNDPKRWVICEFNNFGIRRRMLRTYNEKIIYEEPADEAAFSASVGKKSLLPSVSFDTARVKMFDLAQDPFEHHNIYSPKRVKMPRWKTLVEYLKNYREPKSFALGINMVEQLDPETREDLKALGYIR